MAFFGLSQDMEWLITTVQETVFILLIYYWMKFDKKQAKKRKPRQKKADVQVTVPTVVKVEKQDGELA